MPLIRAINRTGNLACGFSLESTLILLPNCSASEDAGDSMKKFLLHVGIAAAALSGAPALAADMPVKALPVAAATQSATVAAPSLASKAIFFASDGMRPDLMERYAAAGAMPKSESAE